VPKAAKRALGHGRLGAPGVLRSPGQGVTKGPGDKRGESANGGLRGPRVRGTGPRGPYGQRPPAKARGTGAHCATANESHRRKMGAL